MTFRYDAGPLMATSCFPNDNNRRRRSSGSSLPCLTRSNWGLPYLSPCLSLHLSLYLSSYLSLCTGWSGHSWLRRHHSLPAVPVSEMVHTCGHAVGGDLFFRCLLPLSSDLPLCTSTSWCESWTSQLNRISPDSLSHSEANASVSLSMGGKKLYLCGYFIRLSF